MTNFRQTGSAILLLIALGGCSQMTTVTSSGPGSGPLAPGWQPASNRGSTITARQGRGGRPDRSPARAASLAGGGTTLTGIISDSMCGLNHEGMIKTGSMGQDSASCTLKCVEAGSKFVLADPVTGRIYRLSDQSQARAFAGKRVKIRGLVNEAVKTVTVEEIRAE